MDIFPAWVFTASDDIENPVCANQLLFLMHSGNAIFFKNADESFQEYFGLEVVKPSNVFFLKVSSTYLRLHDISPLNFKIHPKSSLSKANAELKQHNQKKRNHKK